MPPFSPTDPRYGRPGSEAKDWVRLPPLSATPPDISRYYDVVTGSIVSHSSRTGTGTLLSPTSVEYRAVTAPGSATARAIGDASAAYGARVTGTTVTSSSTAAASGTVSTPREFRSEFVTPRGASRYSWYPSDLQTTKQDRIKFEMFAAGSRVTPGGSGIDISSSSSRLGAFGSVPSGERLGTVFLGIQGNISDSNSVDWSGATMNPIQASLAARSIEAMKNPTENVANLLGRLTSSILNDAKRALGNKNTINNLQILLAQEAVQAQGLLSRLSGQVANPNLELLFNGPQLRPFTFNFRLTPRNTSESANVKKIIRFFKEGMAVRTVAGGIFLQSPNIFQIQFQSGEDGEAHRSLPRIKKCALIRCDVNYTPDGSYMTYADSSQGYPMTCYELSLAFSELEPVTQSDYASDSGARTSISPDEIGY